MAFRLSRRRGFSVTRTNRYDMFNLSAPSAGTFFISLILGGVGVAARLGYIPALAHYAFWILCAGLVALLLGNLFKGL